MSLTTGDFRTYRWAAVKGRIARARRDGQRFNRLQAQDGGIAMSFRQQTDTKTRMFARVLGPFLVVVTVTAVGRSSQMRTLLSEFGANSVWPWVAGAFVLLSGLIVVALHQNWRGAPAIIVSILGWMTTLKGLCLV